MKKILAIDDKQENLITIKAVIKNNLSGCKMFTAVSGKEGIRIARKEQPDTILLDIVMPQMDGYEVCKRLKEDELTKHIPVVMLTAIKTDSESRVKGLNIGADAFLSKPIDSIELSAQVNVMLRIKEAEDGLRAEKEQLDQKVKERTKELQRANKKQKQDIVERKRIEEEMHKLVAVVKHSSELVNLSTLDGKMIFLNEAGGKMLGIEPHEVENVNIMEVIPDHLIGLVEKELLPALMKGGTWEGDLQYRNLRTAELTDVHAMTFTVKDPDTLEPQFLANVSFDITERKRLDEILQSSEERLKILFEFAPDAIYMNDPKGNFIDGNKAAEEMLGYKREELIGKNFLKLKLLSAKEVPKALKSLAYSVVGKKTGPDEFLLNRKDGEKIPVEISTYPVKIKNKTVVLGIARDITKRKKAENSLKIALKKSTESDQLKSTFLATMSHELRTPLNAVIGFSQLLNKEASGEEVEEFANRIHKSGSHLLEIIEDIFDITLIEAGEIKITKEKQNIRPLVEDLLVMIKTEQQKLNKHEVDIQLNSTNKNHDLHLFTDHRRLKQILINLLSNAIKFTDKGLIELGYEKKIQHDQHVLQFYVNDTGIGIPKEKQKLIFDVFRQVDDTHTRRYGGTGIGLSIVKKLTELLGGNIWVESEEGAGSTFYFTIPYDKLKETSKPRSDQPKKKQSLMGKTVLIVEDVISSFDFLDYVLKKSGIEPVWAKDGKEAIKLCKENSSIDLVLMDINMPVMNGYEATKEIKKFRSKLPIIAQTAYAIAGDREKSLAAGCDDYISKPIKAELLMEKIGKLLS